MAATCVDRSIDRSIPGGQSAGVEDVTSKYDVVVIGTGSAASTAAMRCRKAGRQVAVIDSRPFGGTCALRGCAPKKVLVGAAEVLDWTRRMGKHGIRADQAQIDWPRGPTRSFCRNCSASLRRSYPEAPVAVL